MSAEYAFARISDGALLAFFKDLMSGHPDAKATYQLAATEAFSLTSDQVLKKEWAAVISQGTHLITSASVSLPQLSLTGQYHRGKIYGRNSQGGRVWQPASSEYVDGLLVDGDAGDEALRILGVIKKHLNMAPPAALVDAGASALAQSAAVLNRVSEAVADLTAHTSERQKDLDATRLTLAADAEKVLKSREGDLKARYKTKHDELNKREEELSKRASELDDRENTHVRRELQKQMASISDSTLEKNLLNRSFLTFSLPIALVTLSVIALGWLISNEIGVINGLNDSVRETATSRFLPENAKPLLISNFNSTILFAQLRIGLQGLGAAALVWFALRLASRRYRQVSRWEHELHKFRLDTERAGFLIEGDLEARKVNEVGLPEVMLDRFSRGLFATSGDAGSETSADSVGSTLSVLLGRAAGIKMGPQGLEVTVDKRGIRGARRELDDAEGGE